jgi:hypothetical protein
MWDETCWLVQPILSGQDLKFITISMDDPEISLSSVRSLFNDLDDNYRPSDDEHWLDEQSSEYTLNTDTGTNLTEDTMDSLASGARPS